MRLPIEDFTRIEHIFGAYDLGTTEALILETRKGKTHFAIERDGERSSMCSLDDWTADRLEMGKVAHVCAGCNVRGLWEHRCHGPKCRCDMCDGNSCCCVDCAEEVAAMRER